MHISGDDRYCCDYVWKWCVEHCRTPIVYSYEGKNVEGTDNYLNITNPKFYEYSKKFDEKLNELYNNFSNDVSIFKSYILKLISDIKSKKRNINNK